MLKRLAGAVERQAPRDYREAQQRLTELDRHRKTASRRRELLAALQTVAPAWAQAIQERRPPHDKSSPPGDAQAAWLWRQLHDELERRGKTSLPALQAQIDRLGPALRRVTAELIERRAWAAQVRRTTPQQQQALVGWLDMVRRIGKGMGDERRTDGQSKTKQKTDICRVYLPCPESHCVTRPLSSRVRFAVTSISTFISGRSRPATTTRVAAGRISAKISPQIFSTRSASAGSTM